MPNFEDGDPNKNKEQKEIKKIETAEYLPIETKEEEKRSVEDTLLELGLELRDTNDNIYDFLIEKLPNEKEWNRFLRTYRDYNLALEIDAILNQLESSTSLENKNQENIVYSFLEQRRLNKLFLNTEKGSKIISITVPSNPLFSIKSFNDTFFTPQITDEIIAKRKELINKQLSEYCELLESDYKTSSLKIKENVQLEQSQLENIIEEINKELQNFILSKIEEAKKKGTDPQKYAILEKNIQNFKIYYGISEVEENKNEDKVLAWARSIEMAKLAEEKQENGLIYNDSLFQENLNKINKLKQEIKETFPQQIKIQINNKEKNVNIFNTIIKDRKTIDLLNPDLIKLIRKNQLNEDIILDENIDKPKLVNLLKSYKEAINIIDYFKPFTYEELSSPSLEKELNFVKTIKEKIANKEKLDSEELKFLEKRLIYDSKDQDFTSKHEFLKASLNIDNAVYISLDVIGLGNNLFNEYEEILAEMQDADPEKQKELILKAGDTTTKKMREVRQIVKEILHKYEILYFPTLVGGDEITITLDKSLFDKNPNLDLDKLLFELKEATNTRVMANTVNFVERNTKATSTVKEKILEHLKSLDKLDELTHFSKELESDPNLLEYILMYKLKKTVEIHKPLTFINTQENENQITLYIQDKEKQKWKISLNLAEIQKIKGI